MDPVPVPATPSDTSSAPAAKRKREDSASTPSAAPAPKASKTSSQLSINYLARSNQDDLPLLTKDDTLPATLHLLTAYSNVLDRHESLASNLGARPLGPILIKRFERCFDAPPKIVASHHKGSGSATTSDDSSHTITWLEVIEFARSHPGQFTLSTFSEGKRVCQFYYPQKQLRVQISEEDFLFINSGRCQELIPPLPIWEDEEKEVGTCDVLETKLKELTNIADMVAARTRQLSHRLKGRRSAILERRAEGGSGTPAKASAVQTTTAPGTGLTPAPPTLPRITGDGDASTVSFANVRSELLKHFEGLPQNQSKPKHTPTTTLNEQSLRPDDRPENPDSTGSSLSPIPASYPADTDTVQAQQAVAARAGPGTGSDHRQSISIGRNTYNVGHAPTKHNFSRPLPPALESTQPFRPLCQAHMDGLPRGTRVMPPCDRCRRLRMDCVKNLTSCAGCTKKHARCHWRDVSRDELGDLDHLMESGYTEGTAPAPEGHALTHYDYDHPMNGYVNGGDRGVSTGVYSHQDDYDESEDEDSNPLEDLEALGEKEEQRERELAEQAKMDEEGLEQARELARKGREAAQAASADGGAVAVPEQLMPEPAPADQPVPESAAPAPPMLEPTHADPAVETGINGTSTATTSEPLHAPAPAPPPPPETTYPAPPEPDVKPHQPSPPPPAPNDQPPQRQNQPPAFVPLYADAPVHGGFHAVNKPAPAHATGGTGGWSSTA